MHENQVFFFLSIDSWCCVLASWAACRITVCLDYMQNDAKILVISFTHP